MKKIFGFILMAIAILASYSNLNAQQWIYNDENNGIQIIYTFQLITNDDDTSLNVDLLIEDNPTGTVGTTVDFGTLSLNSQNILNNDSLSSMLASRYSSLTSTYGRTILIRHSEFLQSMISTIKDTTLNAHSFVFQALGMYKTIAEAANRDINNTGNVGFTIFGGYNVAISSFAVEEDLSFDIDDFKSYLRNRKLTDDTNVGIDYYLGALQNDSLTTLSMKEISNKLVKYFESLSVAWPTGGQCGCCGNYVGPCLHWNTTCLAHDYLCQQCQHWWCLPGCVPSSCSGNTIGWIWWILPHP